MKHYYDVKEGLTRYIIKITKVQKVVSTADVNLINGATLLRLGIELLHECGLWDKTLDEWEGLIKSNQTWDAFQD